MGSVGIDDTTRTWKRAGFSGEEGIDLTCCLTTFGDCPNNQRLTSSAIASCEYFRVGSAVSTDGCRDVTSVVQWKSWRV